MSQENVLPRSEIALEHTWNATSVFPSEEAWEAERQAVIALVPTLERFKGKLGESPQRLAEWFEANDEVQRRQGKLYTYASMSYEVDTTNQTAKMREDQEIALYGRLVATTSFAEPELLELGEETLRRWVKEEPRLAPYEHYIDVLLRLQAHVRSAEVEELLGMVIEPFASASSTSRIMTNADMTFRPATTESGSEVPVFQGNLDSLVASPDRELRRTAWESYADSHLALKNTLSNALTAAVKQDVFMARARRHDSALKASLAPHNIPTEVFHNLINTYKRHLPTWHRYWDIRRRALGYDKLHVYDVKAPLSKASPTISYAQSVDWICEGMAPLGEEYCRVMRRGLTDERWVDIYPNQGKSAGAFSSGAPGTHPFILMSYTDDLDSLSTLAHEIGHSMHSYFTWESQPMPYTNYSMFVAEVASNFNQALVRAHLLERNSDPEFQIAVIEEAMSNFHRYFFIMPTLARFELEMHERVERGEGVSADGLIGLMADLFQEGFGNDVAVDRERVGITWAQFQHLYANFYVFQYATGISAAHALAQGVREGKAGAAENYVSFLRAGNSLYPMDALRLAGVDMSTPEAVEQTYGVLAGLVDRLESLVAQR